MPAIPDRAIDIAFTPTGSVAATNVQAAIEESLSDATDAVNVKADKTVPAVDGNVATLDSEGNLADGGVTVAQLSLPVSDGTAIAKGSSDSTKRIRFEVDGLTTGTTRVLTVPNASFTIAGIDIAQTWAQTQTFSVVRSTNTAASPIQITHGDATTTAMATFTNSFTGTVGTIDWNARWVGNFLSANGFTYAVTNNLVSFANDLTVSWQTTNSVFTGSLDIVFGRATTSTPFIRADSATGVAPTLQLQGKSSTTSGRAVFDLQASWVSSTDASRTARAVLGAYDTAFREAVRMEGSGSAALIGFLGAAAVAQQSIGAAATDAASTQTLVNNIRTALTNLGLCKT